MAMCLQSLYGAVDLMIVGQCAESADVSASATGAEIMGIINSLGVIESAGVGVAAPASSFVQLILCMVFFVLVGKKRKGIHGR